MKPLTYTEAIEWARKQGIVLPAEYYGLLFGRARAAAFSVAGVSALDQLQAINDSLLDVMENGGTFAKWRKDALDGKIPLDFPDFRKETIFRTNIQGWYAAGRCRSNQSNKEERPYLMYSAINDSRTRPAHAAMDGTILPIDHPWWKTHLPPNGFNSLLPDQKIVGGVQAALKAMYSGPAVEIIGQTPGVRLRLTAYHPVLTRRGWVDAKDIREGDELVCYSGKVDGCSMTTDLDEYNPPAEIEQVFETLMSRGSVSMPGTSFDLNGDEGFINGNIDIVSADSTLLRNIESFSAEHIEYIGLVNTLKSPVSLSGNSAFVSHSVSTNRIIPLFACSNSSHFSVAPKTIGAVSPGHGRSSVNYNPILPEESGHSFCASTILFCNMLNSDSRHVFINYPIWKGSLNVFSFPSCEFVGNQFSSLTFGALDASFRDVFIGGFWINPNALCDIIDAHPGKVKFDKVIDTRRFDYCGHVYDAQCNNGIIIAYGENKLHPVISNCRCSSITLDEDEVEEFGGVTVIPTDALPDKGWDYSPCKHGPEEGVKRAIDAHLDDCGRGFSADPIEQLSIQLARSNPCHPALQKALQDIKDALATWDSPERLLRDVMGNRRYNKYASDVANASSAHGIQVPQGVMLRAYTHREYMLKLDDGKYEANAAINLLARNIHQLDASLPFTDDQLYNIGIMLYIMDGAIESLKPTRNTYWRGVATDRMPDDLRQRWINAHRKGRVVQYNGFTSIAHEEGAKYPGDWQIRLHLESARNIQAFSVYNDPESVLPRNVQFEYRGFRDGYRIMYERIEEKNVNSKNNFGSDDEEIDALIRCGYSHERAVEILREMDEAGKRWAENRDKPVSKEKMKQLEALYQRMQNEVMLPDPTGNAVRR